MSVKFFINFLVFFKTPVGEPYLRDFLFQMVFVRRIFLHLEVYRVQEHICRQVV